MCEAALGLDADRLRNRLRLLESEGSIRRADPQEYRVTGGGSKFYKLGPGRNARVVYRPEELDAWAKAFARPYTSEQRK